MAVRVALDETAPEHAENVAAFQQHEVERQLRDVAGSKADDKEASLPGDRTQRRFAVIPADRIVDHVGAAATGDLPQGFLDVVTGVVNAIIGAMLARKRK